MPRDIYTNRQLITHCLFGMNIVLFHSQCVKTEQKPIRVGGMGTCKRKLYQLTTEHVEQN